MIQPAEISLDPDTFSTLSRDEDFLSIGEILIARAYLYTLCHKLFATAPDQEVLHALLSDTTGEVLRVLSEGESVLEAFADYLHSLRKTNDLSLLLKKIQGEYTRTYIGPAEPVALPYASPYKTHDRAVFQMNTVEVRRWYRKNGLEPKQLLRLPDDHIAILCAFCAYQGNEMVNTFFAGNRGAFLALLIDQLQFIPEHINSWIDDYAFRLRRSESAYVYPQLVEAFAAFTHCDERFLSQAALWVEGNGEMSGSEVDSVDFSPSDISLSDECKDALIALQNVQRLRPKNVEDCELQEFVALNT